MRVLIVDDDPLFPRELSELLSGEGYGARAVDSADAAIGALESEWFDVLLTDLRMPRKSGTVLLDEATRRWPGMRSVILTGQPTDEAIASSLRHGAFNFVGKPFQLDELLWVLSLVQQDLDLVARLAPPLDPTELPGTLAPVPSGRRILLGDPLAAIPELAPSPWPSERADGPAPALDAGGLVVHLGWSAALTEGPDARIDRTLRVLSRIGPDQPVLVVGDRRGFATAHFLSLWAALEADGVTTSFPGTLGPQRRELLNRLDGREAELQDLAQEIDWPRAGARARLYLEDLVTEGLIAVRGPRYRLTPLGDAVVDVLRRAPTERPASSSHRALRLEGPPLDPRPRGRRTG
jgi:CheY-like chemotaxis protein